MRSVPKSDSLPWYKREKKLTAQMPEVLTIRGKKHDLCTTPFEDYLSKLRKPKRPKFTAPSTACGRGYVGEWEIIDKKLYLTGLSGVITNGGDPRDIPPINAEFADLFPKLKLPLFADWFTGELRCPEGKLLGYVHHMFASTYERDRLIWVQNGEVRVEKLRLNPPDPVWYTIHEDGSRTLHDNAREDGEPLHDLFAPDETPTGYRYWGQPPVDDGEEEGYVLGGYLTYY